MKTLPRPYAVFDADAKPIILNFFLNLANAILGLRHDERLDFVSDAIIRYCVEQDAIYDFLLRYILEGLSD